MDVHIIDRPDITVAGLPYPGGPYGPGANGVQGQGLRSVGEAAGLLNRARYGICHDDPDAVAPEQCRYECHPANRGDPGNAGAEANVGMALRVRREAGGRRDRASLSGQNMSVQPQ